MHVPEGTLRDFLLDAGLLSRGQLDAAVRGQEGKPLGKALIDAGVLTEDEVRRAAAHAMGISFVVLESGDIDTAALELLPEPLCREHSLAAYRLAGERLEIAVLDLSDLEALEPLKSRLPYKLVPRLTTRESLRRALLAYHKHLKEKFGDKLQKETNPQKVLETLLRHASLQSASEVHLETRSTGLLVRYRHGRAVREAMLLPASAQKVLSVIRTLSGVGSRTLPQEGRFKFDLGSGESLLVRVSSIPVVGGEKLVLYLVPEAAGSKGFTLEGLGFHGAGAAALRAALHDRSGMILVCGPAGSGRTTLLYTLLDMAHAPQLSLASVEESVAYRLPYVAQTQVRAQEGLSAAAALRAVLRGDPDVVMVDRITDRDTAALCLSAAARGMLVLASIDAPDTGGGLQKLRDLGADESQFEHITLAVGTGLVRRLCGKQARSTHKLERRHLSPLEPFADFAKVLAALKDESLVSKEVAWKDVSYAQATGCSECDRGYRGFVGVFEVAPHGGEPLLTKFEDALFKAAAGVTSATEALLFAEKHAHAHAQD